MFGWLRRRAKARPIPDGLWNSVIAAHPFLARRTVDEQQRMRALSEEFLASKEFTGVHGVTVTDEMAVAIAAQAVLPVLNLGLHWYDDFVGIVVHPGDAVARRSQVDEAGVVHQYDEVLSGEAMDGGPVMLSMQAVAESADTAPQGYNVIIHEFAHKIDMRDGDNDGCPPLTARFMGAASVQQARVNWLATLTTEYDRFREEVIIAERFGGSWPWLDSYGATAIDEFFAVCCEAYFVNRAQFDASFPKLVPMFDEFFGNANSQLSDAAAP
ncbi:zinc-dependent peptidase [Variovorax sp. VNK109]|uniref:M90 family metallopeptidase n=1 Tax=Variovorax sp. VNK109 TaxID=3400919 RepID=UPI003BFAF990